MEERLIIVDGYNVILRSPRLRPGPNRTLRESREKLVNLLSWMMGADDARFIVVFDGDDAGAPAGAPGPAGSGADPSTGRIQILWSRPPEKADDVIRRIVEKRVGGDEQITVVTSDIDVARHARAEGADVSLSDLFLASALGDVGRDPGASGAEDEGEDKPVSLSKKELAEWAEIFTRRKPASEPGGEQP